MAYRLASLFLNFLSGLLEFLLFVSRRQIAHSGQQGTVSLHEPHTGHHDEP
jgi:hypothetical protein